MRVSRRGFLAAGAAAGGGLVVAASIPGMALAERVLGAAPASAVFAPSVYIAIGTDGIVTLTIGKSEMGQGTLTGIAQLVADELGCTWDDIQVVQAVAAPGFGLPGIGLNITGGSRGLRSEWNRMRAMGAAARMMLVEAAAKRWQADPAALVVKDGIVAGPDGRRASFGALAAEAAILDVPAKPSLNSAKARTVIGQPMKRLDTRQKITGQAVYGIDVELPDLVTAVVIPPPRLSAPVKSVKAEAALARPGVQAVVPISSGVAIVGDHYWAVHSARDDIVVEWGESPFEGLGMDTLRQGYRDALDKSGKIAEATGDPARIKGGRTVTREVEQPYLAHACMEPMNFTVWIKDGAAEAWGPTQAQSFVQGTAARVAGIDPKKVTVHTTFLGGGFGRRSAQDFVQAAAEVSKAVGKPVKLVYSREDDMRAGRYRPFNLTRATGTLDDAGALAGLDVKIAAPAVARWAGLKFLIRKDGVDRAAVEGLAGLPYAIPNTRVEWVEHDPKVPVHFWRAVGASHNPFVIETLLDELAKEAGKDPLDFRRALLMDKPRHLAVLDKLANEAGWAKPAPEGVGRGLALVGSFGSIVGQVAELRMIDGAPVVDKVTCVIDCGVAVNPGQIEAQMQGAIVFGLSAFLRGAITLEDGAVEQSNFHDYEPLRMPEMPEIDVHILEGDTAPGGIGEPGLPPLLPVVANAIFALTGEKVTRLPYGA